MQYKNLTELADHLDKRIFEQLVALREEGTKGYVEIKIEHSNPETLAQMRGYLMGLTAAISVVESQTEAAS